MRAPLLLLALAAGCYQPVVATGLPCADNGACPSGLECRAGTCERPGGDGGLALDAAIDACSAATCSGNDIIGCGEPVTCTTACSSIGGAHCMVLVPSNGLAATMLAGATADVIGNWTFYDDGEIRKGNIILRTSGTGVIAGIGFQEVEGMSVFTARSFTAPEGNSLEASPGSNPVVLFAATTIIVGGVIDAGANGDIAGPGGTNGNTSTASSGCRGGAGRLLGTGVGDGGGGGGGATAGGTGGPSATGVNTGRGGTACSGNPTTIPLRGGNGGGAGAQSTSNAGGGGGGGLALVAMESITITGTVGSPGGGGVAGNGNGGGGGGGGGAVFLEAPTVIISGAVTANGGSGAAPSTGDGFRGNMTSATPTVAGSDTCPIINLTRRGGVGGAGMTSPTTGQTCTYDDGLGTNGSRGAGGGGSVGRIEIKALVASTQGAVISPPPAMTTPLLE